jgi:hypothetical protein
MSLPLLWLKRVSVFGSDIWFGYSRSMNGAERSADGSLLGVLLWIIFAKTSKRRRLRLGYREGEGR